MKKSSILILMILCLFGCKQSSNEVKITGEIKGLGTDTLYLYGIDESYDRIDTIYVNNDKFSFTTRVDTLAQALLFFNEQTEYPIFLYKGNKISIKGNIDQLDVLTVEGNTENEELSQFLQSTKGVARKEQEQKAEAFIREHHSSQVSLYLLDKFLVRKDSVDLPLIKSLIETMTGVLQDTPYIEQLKETIAQKERTAVGQYAPFFSLPNAKGENITRSFKALQQKILLINIWASWSDSLSNKQDNRELRAIYRKYKQNKHFAMLGVSFDIDKKQWKEAVKKDSLNWEQACDFGGLNSEFAKQYDIDHLPTNILLSSDGQILFKGLRGDSLKKKIEELVSEVTEKEKNKNKNKQ